MLFEYETQRLLLKIIKPEYGSSVLEFYLRDKALFERYEPGFTQKKKKKKHCILNLIKQSKGRCSGSMCMRRRIHRRLLARLVFSIFFMRLVGVARQVTNSPAGFIITDMQRRH